VDVFHRTIWNHIDRFGMGLLVTVEISLIAFFVAIVAGLLLALLRMYVKPLRWPAGFLIQFSRNTPIYVQLIWVAYVWPDIFGWPLRFFDAGWAALALQSAGYLAETFRAGIEGVPAGNRHAAQALGMGPVLTMRRIVLPQAFLTMSPSIMNQFLVVIKSSTLVSVIAVPDLMYEAQRLVSIWFEPIEILSFTAFIYIVIVFLLSRALKGYSDRLRARYGL
jgi:polar amino acid transport system permease protein